LVVWLVIWLNEQRTFHIWGLSIRVYAMTFYTTNDLH